jgi:hypothetical protein
VSFAAMNLCVASQRVFVVVVVVVVVDLVMTQSGNVWIHPRALARLCSFRVVVLYFSNKTG